MKRISVVLLACSLILTACGSGGAAKGDGDDIQTDPNLPPRVTLPASISVEGSMYTLPIDASDPEGDPLLFTWQVMSGPGIPRINDATLPTPSVQFPLAGTYRFDVAVRDDAGHTTHEQLECVVSGNDFTITVHVQTTTASSMGIPVCLVWSDSDVIAAEVISDDDGMAEFPAALGEPDDFRIVVQ